MRPLHHDRAPFGFVERPAQTERELQAPEPDEPYTADFALAIVKHALHSSPPFAGESIEEERESDHCKDDCQPIDVHQVTSAGYS